MATVSSIASLGRPGRIPVGGTALLSWVERRIGLTPNGLVVAACAVFGWLLGRFIASRALSLLVYGVVIVLAAAYALGRRRLSVTAARSQLPTRVREGQSVNVELSLKASRGVNTILLEERLVGELGQNVLVPVPHLPAGQEVSHSYTFVPRRRGVYPVGPLTATWSDPFGLTRHRMVLSKPERIIVHPATELVHDRVISREWEDPPIRPPISRRWPTGFEFYGLRDYVSGDDPRRIVWRATAKSLDSVTGDGRYLIREAEQGITDQVIIILDTSRDRHSPGDPSESFETAVRAAASLGVRHLRDGFSVTIEANSAQLAGGLRGRRSEIPLLDQMAMINLESAPAARPIERLLTSGQRNSHHVLITPYLSRSTAGRLRLLLDRGMSVLIALITFEDSDPLSAHRAGGLGCNVVELRANASMERVFQQVTFLRAAAGGHR